MLLSQCLKLTGCVKVWGQEQAGQGMLMQCWEGHWTPPPLFLVSSLEVTHYRETRLYLHMTILHSSYSLAI